MEKSLFERKAAILERLRDELDVIVEEAYRAYKADWKLSGYVEEWEVQHDGIRVKAVDSWRGGHDEYWHTIPNAYFYGTPAERAEQTETAKAKIAVLNAAQAEKLRRNKVAQLEAQLRELRGE